MSRTTSARERFNAAARLRYRTDPVYRARYLAQAARGHAKRKSKNAKV